MSFNYDISIIFQIIIKLFLNDLSDTSYCINSLGQEQVPYFLLCRVHLYTKLLGLIEVLQKINAKSSKTASQEHII